MVDQPPYRKPHEDADGRRGAPRHTLIRGEAPLLGAYAVSVGLSSAITLAVDRRALELTPGSGARVEFEAAPLPAVDLLGLRLDLTSFAFELDADNLGPFTSAAGSILSRELAARVLRPAGLLGATPGAEESPVALFLDSCPEDDKGRREVLSRGLPLSFELGLWMTPDARVEARVDGRQAEVQLSSPLLVRAPLVRLAIRSARLELAGGRIIVEQDPAVGWFMRLWGALLLRIALWVAGRWLQRRLPPAMRSERYNLFEDPDRAETLAALIANLRAPASSSSSGDGGEGGASGSVASALQGTLAALTAEQLPADAWVIARVPLGDERAVAVCADEGADLELSRTDEHIRLSSSGARGLYLHADSLPALSRLALRGVTLRLRTRALELELEPALGSFERALIQHLVSTVAMPMVPADVAAMIGLGEAPWGPAPRVLFKKAFGDPGDEDAPAAIVRAPGDVALTLRCSAGRVELASAAPIEIALQGVPLAPDLSLSRVRYDRRSGDVRVTSSPALGALEQRVITQIVRHRVAPLAPALAEMPGPETSPPIPLEQLASHELVLHEQTTPLGPVQLRMAPDDRLSLRVGAGLARLTSAEALLVAVPELQLVTRLEGLSIELVAGRVDLLLEPGIGAYVERALQGALAGFRPLILAGLQGALRPWPEDRAHEPWVLQRASLPVVGELEISLPAGGAVVVERHPGGVELRATPCLHVKPLRPGPLPVFELRGLRWQLPYDRWALMTKPDVGPLVQELIGALAGKLLPPMAVELAGRLGLPEPDPARVRRPPPKRGPLVLERALPTIGPARVCLPADGCAAIEIDQQAMTLTLGAGVVVWLPELHFVLRARGVEISWSPWTVDCSLEPALGSLTRQVAQDVVTGLLREHARLFWPDDTGCPEGHVTLLVLGRDEPWGPLRMSVPHGGGLAVELDPKGVALVSSAGIVLQSPNFDWLPSFRLNRLGYTFETGAIDIDISGVEQRFYHEDEDVSAMTESILAHLFKVLVAPKVPEMATLLGFVRHAPPPAIRPPFGRIKLFVQEVSPELGLMTLSMDADDIITVQARDDEVSLSCTLGLLIDFPQLRLQVELRRVRYHPKSGEVQVDGFGQLENAVVEAIIERQYRAVMAKQGHVVADGQTPVSAFIDGRDMTRKGRISLGKLKMRVNLVEISMDPATKFSIKFGAEGLEFVANPPLYLDTPGFADFELGSVRYTFKDSRFKFAVKDDGLMPDFLTEMGFDMVAKWASDFFLPMLPPVMREPGYSLADDINPSETLAALIAGVTAKAGAGKGKGKG